MTGWKKALFDLCVTWLLVVGVIIIIIPNESAILGVLFYVDNVPYLRT